MPMSDLSENLLQTKDGQPIEIPFNGSLGILALGDIGLLLWRKRRKEIIAEELKRRKEQNER